MSASTANRIEKLGQLIIASERFAVRRENFLENISIDALAPDEIAAINNHDENIGLDLFTLYLELDHYSQEEHYQMCPALAA